VRADETQELSKEGDISFFQRELEASSNFLPRGAQALRSI